MTVSQSFKDSAYGDETATVWLVLLTIFHSTFVSDIRVVNNKEDIVSRGDRFLACAFEPVLAANNTGALPTAQIRIDNISQELIEEIRRVDSALRIKIEIVSADNPDMVEYTMDGFTLRNVKADIHTITGTLSLEDLRAEKFPADSFTPANFPGLF